MEAYEETGEIADILRNFYGVQHIHFGKAHYSDTALMR